MIKSGARDLLFYDSLTFLRCSAPNFRLYCEHWSDPSERGGTHGAVHGSGGRRGSGCGEGGGASSVQRDGSGGGLGAGRGAGGSAAAWSGLESVEEGIDAGGGEHECLEPLQSGDESDAYVTAAALFLGGADERPDGQDLVGQPE